MRLKSARGLACFALFAGCGQAIAQTIVDIDQGQTFTDADLAAGVFDGQPFTPGSSTAFRVNDGGVLEIFFSSFRGSTIEVNAGGSIGDGSFIESATINVFDGGAVGFMELFGSMSVLGGHVDGVVLDGRFAVSGGRVSRVADFGDGTLDAEISGGVIENAQMSGGSLEVRGGRVDRITGGDVIRGFGSVEIFDGGSVGEVGGGPSSSSIFVEMSGGTVDNGIRAAGGGATVSGGVIDGGVRVSASSDDPDVSPFGFRMSGGLVRGGVEFSDFSSGAIGNARVNISGGRIEGGFFAQGFNSNDITISGGEIDGLFVIESSLDVEFIVARAFLDGQQIGLAIDDTITIDTREGSLLELVFADGAFLDIELNDVMGAGDFFDTNATLAITRVVPSPGPVIVVAVSGVFAARRRR
ncbi:MAG: hypothetical protein AAGI53_07035 [Planctomycetota bacterium]